MLPEQARTRKDRKVPQGGKPGKYPGTRTRGHEPARYGVSTVTPPPASSLQGLCGHLYERLMQTQTLRCPALGQVGLLLLGLRPATRYRARSVGLRPFALGAVAPLLRSPAATPLISQWGPQMALLLLVGTGAPLALCVTVAPLLSCLPLMRVYDVCVKMMMPTRSCRRWCRSRWC